MPAVSIGSVTTGSESFIPAGSIIVTNTVDVLGSVAVTSPINVTTGSEQWIQNFGDLGSDITGSIAIITDPLPVSGVFNVTTGSERWIKNVVEVSGAKLDDLTGSVSNFGDLGSSRVITNFDALGSTVIVDNPQAIGSFTDMALGSVAITNTGSVIQATNPWAVSGIVSVNTPPDQYIQRIDYSGTTFPIYVGLAAPGTDVGTAGWQIKKMFYNSNNLVSGILFASGDTKFNKHWNARTSGPYS